MAEYDSVRDMLTHLIIPFWHHLRDDELGGTYGLMDYNLRVDKKADKGCILNSRILWFFSSAFQLLNDPACLKDADHAYEFLKKAFWDSQNGGVFWSVQADGTPADRTKHTYCQAFAVYGLSAYYQASKNPEALHLAEELFQTIESRCRDKDGYLEAFSEDFQPISNEKLSENGVMAVRTMNTLLHVFEACSELYAVSGSPEAAAKMREILDIFTAKIYNPAQKRQEVFFDKDYHSLIDLHSYGHDIETAWLMRKGVRQLNDPDLAARMNPIFDALAENVLKTGLKKRSMPSECERGVINQERIWVGTGRVRSGLL